MAGGLVSYRRDRELIRALLTRVRACGSVATALLCTDGLASYAKQALLLFRKASRTGRAGRPRLVLHEGVMVARVVKRYARRRRVVEVVRSIVRGTEDALRKRLIETQRHASAVINTAYIERLNATFRARLAPLARRTRSAVRQQRTLEAGMWLVGTCYNFLWPHRSLREERGVSDPPGGRWVENALRLRRRGLRIIAGRYMSC